MFRVWPVTVARDWCGEFVQGVNVTPEPVTETASVPFPPIVVDASLPDGVAVIEPKRRGRPPKNQDTA